MDSFDGAILTIFALLITIYYKFEAIKAILYDETEESLGAISSSGSREITTVIQENDKNYIVFYGTQTGTAEDYAKMFAKELVGKFSLKVMCADVENFDFETLNELPKNVMVSFFISTYGEGDFPDSAVSFEEFLLGLDESEQSLNRLRFTMFGLGNSTYEFFNNAAKKATKNMINNGATLIGNLGEGDDGTATTDEDYLAWKELILEDIKEALLLQEHEQVYEPSMRYDTLIANNVDMDTVSLGEPSKHYLPCNKLPFNNQLNIQTGPFNHNFPYLAPIVKSNELFGKEADRSCVHAEFDISGSNIKYSTGDHLAVWPSNSNEAIKKFLLAFNLDEDEMFTLKPLDSTVQLPFPCPTTVSTAVRYYMEITGPISRQFFNSLIQFAPNADIKQKLSQLSKDKILFAENITSRCYNIADAVLHLSDNQPWKTVPFEFLIESIPPLKPRYYSISSSSSTEKQMIHITAIVEKNIVNDESSPVLSTYGMTTNLIKHIECSQNFEEKTTDQSGVSFNLDGPRDLFQDYKLPVFVRRSTFKLPSNPKTPVIMIGPGTGVAPFRGFIRERVKYLEAQSNSNVNLGKHLLFYGCRNDQDFLYEKEWPVYANTLGEAFQMFVGYSRVPDAPKKYVQHLLREQREQIMSLLKEGAFIYVCGDAKGMSQDVHATLVDIVAEGLTISENEAIDMLKVFKTTGKYQEDVW
ncbi:similar to Saccharomyces cerevisiae YHR042W NCP1 NADP-cytochrome P450 reductase [Maudiozyma saulgeensis]|uniref:NADPH--cytochrome P450 reductase n=1 Tax=Maudiozyma saulgeensis TaxID=1789683 RepID=A0A1X7QYF3_9SACH|nr:similar to Saccharomyces cerevisiae YHR042W NCP1 NADP-cytochrome P450 reductase [Kazachstania saulgeensis]